MHTRYDFTQELLRTELENLIGDIDPVDEIVIAVKAGCGRLVRRIFDNDSR